MIYEANASSSACRLWRIFQVETSTRPSGSYIIGNFPARVKEWKNENRLKEIQRFRHLLAHIGSRFTSL